MAGVSPGPGGAKYPGDEVKRRLVSSKPGATNVPSGHEGGQSPESKAGGLCNDLQIVELHVKNTFLHVVYVKNIDTTRIPTATKRHTSAPPSVTRHGAADANPTKAHTMVARDSGGAESDGNLTGSGQKPTDMETAAAPIAPEGLHAAGMPVAQGGRVATGAPVAPPRSVEAGSSGDGASRKAKRPCQGKRVRYNNFKHDMEERIWNNPDADLTRVEMPAFLADNAPLRRKLFADLESYRQEVNSNAVVAPPPTPPTTTVQSVAVQPLVAASPPLAGDHLAPRHAPVSLGSPVRYPARAAASSDATSTSATWSTAAGSGVVTGRAPRPAKGRRSVA